MKLLSLISFLFLSLSIASAQSSATVIPAPSGELTIVLTPFGMENTVLLGSVGKTGKASLNHKVDFSDVSESVKSMYWIRISELLSFCDNSTALFSQADKIEVLEMGPLFLYKNAEMAGFVTLVSDTALYKWVNDPGYEDAVPGSYFEMVYVSEPFDYKGSCNQTTDLEMGNIETDFEMDIALKAGLNYLEYKIVSVQDIESGEMGASPKKVMVTSHSDLPVNAKWMAYYY